MELSTWHCSSAVRAISSRSSNLVLSAWCLSQFSGTHVTQQCPSGRAHKSLACAAPLTQKPQQSFFSHSPRLGNSGSILIQQALPQQPPECDTAGEARSCGLVLQPVATPFPVDPDSGESLCSLCCWPLGCWRIWVWHRSNERAWRCLLLFAPPHAKCGCLALLHAGLYVFRSARLRGEEHEDVRRAIATCEGRLAALHVWPGA
jgi:hypothetical protein